LDCIQIVVQLSRLPGEARMQARDLNYKKSYPVNLEFSFDPNENR